MTLEQSRWGHRVHNTIRSYALPGTRGDGQVFWDEPSFNMKRFVLEMTGDTEETGYA